MSVSLAQVQSGVVKYVDNEILPKITDWRRWVLGAAVGTALSNMGGIFSELKEQPLVKMLGVIDDKDMIDIDKIYKEIVKQAAKGPVTFDVPMMGPLTLSQADVESLYRYIKESATI